MNTLALALQRFGPKPAVTIAPVAIELRDQILNTSTAVVVVDSPETQEDAANSLHDLKALAKEWEHDRQTIKEPVLDLGRLIDSTVKKELQEVLSEITRIGNLISAFQEEERQRHRAALRRQQEEDAKIERERQEAIRKAQEAERAARREQDLEAQRKAQAEAAAANAAAEKARIDAAKEAVQATPARAEGMVVSEVWQFDVLNIQLLYLHRPDLVRIEPNRAAIQAAIREGLRKCPGLVIWSETKATVRT